MSVMRAAAALKKSVLSVVSCEMVSARMYGFFQFLRNLHQRNVFEQAELMLQVALNLAIAGSARRREGVTCF